MVNTYSADDWNKKKKIDPAKVAEEKKAKATAERKKRVDTAKKQDGYMTPSGEVPKAAS